MRNRESRIFATTKTGWELVDASRAPDRFSAHLPPGKHELTRIHNPFGPGVDWLVLKDTQTGQSEREWRKWRNGQTRDIRGRPIYWGRYEIIIQEIPIKSTADTMRVTDTERRRAIIEKIQQKALRHGRRVRAII